MPSRRKKAKAKITAIGAEGKNTTERKNDARDAAEHVAQNKVTMSFQPIEKVPGVNYFHRLPIEVRQMIYALAVVENDPIRPVQVEKQANKFCGSKTATEAFTSLLLTCRGFYEELLGRPDFYRENTFGFKGYLSLVVFLAALSPARRSMIRKIEYTVQPWETFNRTAGLLQSVTTLLSHCASFQSLSIVIPSRCWFLTNLHPPEALPAHMSHDPMSNFCIKLDGNDWRRLHTTSVLHFQISITARSYEQSQKVLFSGLGVSADHGKLRFSGEHGFVETNAALVKEVQRLNTQILELGTHCSPKYAISKPIVGSRLQEALTRSKLDVYGDNRVGQAHQSGMVSRGTRSRSLRARQVSSNGVLPRVAENPKYIDAYQDEDDNVEA